MNLLVALFFEYRCSRCGLLSAVRVSCVLGRFEGPQHKLARFQSLASHRLGTASISQLSFGGGRRPEDGTPVLHAMLLVGARGADYAHSSITTKTFVAAEDERPGTRRCCTSK